MNLKRRNFLKTLSIASSLTSLPVIYSFSENDNSPSLLDALDNELNLPVLKRELFNTPVIIADIKLLHYNGSFICKVESSDGAEGISISNNLRMDYLYPIFIKRVAPFFLNKDARDLDNLIKGVYTYRSNYKMQSYALGVPLATLEFAILDMLGKIAKKPMGALFGDVIHKKIPIYLATRFRDKSAEASIEKAKELIAENGYKAVKFKIGSKMGENSELVKGRTRKLIPLARKAFGDEVWLGADANGAYDVKEAIRIGKLLEDHNYGFYEEPLPFDWYLETKEVAKNIKIPIAGGEQEASMRNYRWMISENILQIYRQDMFYFGGMIRSVKVARMANLAGYNCVPHISGSGLGYLYALHFISAIPNAGEFHPNSRDKDNPIPITCETSTLQVENGAVTVPIGPGLGVLIDPAFLAKHKPVNLSI